MLYISFPHCSLTAKLILTQSRAPVHLLELPAKPLPSSQTYFTEPIKGLNACWLQLSTLAYYENFEFCRIKWFLGAGLRVSG